MPLKAPASHEPVIPGWTRTVIVVAGLSGLGEPLTQDRVHRPERFAELGGCLPGEPITIEVIARVLAHPDGGMKGSPAGAQRVALLNQADTASLQAAARRLADLLLSSQTAGLQPAYEKVLIASLGLSPEKSPLEISPQGPVHAVRCKVGGILLAGGESRRLGRPKQLLAWRGEPFVRSAARAGLEAGLDPLVVVTGASREEVEAALTGLPVFLAHNPGWAQGQSTSIQAGVRALPPGRGAAVFLLSDQPQVTPGLIRTMQETYFRTGA